MVCPEPRTNTRRRIVEGIRIPPSHAAGRRASLMLRREQQAHSPTSPTDISASANPITWVKNRISNPPLGIAKKLSPDLSHLRAGCSNRQRTETAPCRDRSCRSRSTETSCTGESCWSGTTDWITDLQIGGDIANPKNPAITHSVAIACSASEATEQTLHYIHQDRGA